MRKYHRWLSIVFAVFLLWIATTGVMSQFAAMVAEGQAPPRVDRMIVPPARAHEHEAPAAKPAALPAGFVCPAELTCRPRQAPDSAQAWVGYLHHLHSGEAFGPVGVWLSIASGFALLFFAASGLWMYLTMWRARRGARPRWFWR
ncbi:MAG TPA: PepSY domain-containing protein [Novosphingobium sp.]|nr:PepSY domain-containing protein [Novosphingobium sp.]